MTKNSHYFDWAATSLPELDIIKNALEGECFGNASSLHSFGKGAKHALEDARKRIAKQLGVKSETIFFTSGGTEANHIPILSLLNKPTRGKILVSAIEHPSVMAQCLALKKCGFTVELIPVEKTGIVNVSSVMEHLTQDTMLICIMAVNNETGAIQPIKEIADAVTSQCKDKRKPHIHVDCVQLLGKVPFSLSEWNISSASFSAHKIGGLRGTGVLYLSSPFEPFLQGGGQESGVRSGTENILGAKIFADCIEKHILNNVNNVTNCEQNNEHNADAFEPGAFEQDDKSTANIFEQNNAHNENDCTQSEKRFSLQIKNTSHFIEELRSIPNCKIIPENRLPADKNYSPFIVQASFKNIPGQVMLRALDSKGFCISTGSACSSRKNNRPILEAMKVLKEMQESAVRFSFGSTTTKEEMRLLLDAIKEITK
ncbi:MAG: cysteine desulfurase [Treponema sp.]|nr:cysteine desulfurase [Treponema sp.]